MFRTCGQRAGEAVPDWFRRFQAEFAFQPEQHNFVKAKIIE
jgi:hypothetical protein